MIHEYLVGQLERAERGFLTALSPFSEWDSSFSPRPGMFTVSQQVRHTALVTAWYLWEGFGIGEPGFPTLEQVKAGMSLQEAITLFKSTLEAAKQSILDLEEDYLIEALPEGSPFAGDLRYSVVFSIREHTAHHRGALLVYARLMGKVPPRIEHTP